MGEHKMVSGSAVVEVTPERALFLYGYPHVQRISTGTHDPLLASALYIENGEPLPSRCLFLAVDVIFVSKSLTASIRERISKLTPIPPDSILLSATHTHSGPVTLSYVSNEYDATVPPPDEQFMKQLEDGIVEAGIAAWRSRRPAELSIVHANAAGIGSCRHRPDGPSDLSIPVISVRDRRSGGSIGLMLVCAMHPTVLHEDSTLYSGDFPAFARQYLQANVVGRNCPVVCHTGASGNQSPRHVTRGNTFAEAHRLGEILGRAVEHSLKHAKYECDIDIQVAHTEVELPLRDVPTIADAEKRVAVALGTLNAMKGAHASPAERRSAECDWFGAEELLAIAHAASQGRLETVRETILPAEIQVISLGELQLVAWPGEFFVEFALQLRSRHPHSRVITLANGDLQGYVVTQEAIDHKWYEAGNALLKSPEAGKLVVEATAKLLNRLESKLHV